MEPQFFFPRWCPSGASNFRPDMAAQCAKLHKIVSLIRISIKDSRNCNYLRTKEKHFVCIGHGARTFCDAIFRVPKTLGQILNSNHQKDFSFSFMATYLKMYVVYFMSILLADCIFPSYFSEDNLFIEIP